MARQTIYEWLDEHHARERNRVFWDPEAVAERRRLDREEAAQLCSRSECSECGAGYGQPCVGLVQSVHYARQLDFVRRGSWIASA